MKKFTVLDIKIDAASLQAVLDFIDTAVSSHKKVQIATVNNEFVVEAQKNKKFKEILNNATLSVADSTGIVKAIEYLHGQKVEKIPGADLFFEICRQAAEKEYRIYLLGGKKDVAKKAKLRLQNLYHGLHVVGVKDGVVVSNNTDNSEIIYDINRAKADILFVALGAPKQDIWINHNLEKLNCSVFVGVGGTLDYASGSILRAPKIMRKAGLEWLFRLAVQPKRIGRVFRATVVFPYLVYNSRRQKK